MLGKDFLVKCTPETKNIIEKYLYFISLICTKDVINSDAYRPNYKNGNWDKESIAIFYFLYIVYCNKNVISQIMKYHGVSCSVNVKVSQKLIEANNAYLNLMTIESLFTGLNGNITALSLVNAYSNLSSKVTLERIILNLMNDNPKYNWVFNIFKLNEIKHELENIASDKEYGTYDDNTYDEKPMIEFPVGELLNYHNYPYNPLIGREKEFRQMCSALMSDRKSLILYGDAGVGKTTLIHGLAYKIQNGTAPESLLDKQILSISAEEFNENTAYRGTLEEKVKKLIKLTMANPDVIWAVDEIHQIIGLGQVTNSNLDVSGILLPYLSDGRIKIIGATTTNELKYINESPAFSRRFKYINIPKLSNEDIYNILSITIDRYETDKGIKFGFPDEIKKEILWLIINITNKQSNNYLKQYLKNPDYALDFLDNCYNYAMLDAKDTLDIESLNEGASITDNITPDVCGNFKDDINRLVRTNKIKKN